MLAEPRGKEIAAWLETLGMSEYAGRFAENRIAFSVLRDLTDQDLKELGEWDWMETPVGMVYIDTRRQDDRVWVRVADFILPNIHQFPPNADPMALRNSINRAGGSLFWRKLQC